MRLSLFFLFTLACICISQINAQQDRCSRREVWRNCGSRCEPSCRRPNPRGCSRECVRGCFCRSGLFRNRRGNCVRRNRCGRRSDGGDDRDEDENFE